MTVLVVTDLYPPQFTGGAELVTREVVEGLRKRRHRVVVATAAGRPEEDLVSCFRYQTPRRWAGGRDWITPWHAALEYRRAFQSRDNGRALERLLAGVKPDVVYLAGMNGIGACSILEVLAATPVPVVAHLHDYWLANLVRPGSALSSIRLSAIKRFLIGREVPRFLLFNAMVTPSPLARHEYIARGFEPALIDVIPSGLELPPVARPRQADRSALHLLYAGRLVPEKGVHLLLERLAALGRERGARTITCDIAGAAGPSHYMRRLSRLVGALNGRGRLLGPLDRTVLTRSYSSYDAVVVPSIWSEPFSLVVPEALAAGAAVVASTSVGACNWLAHGREVMLFSPARPVELDAALRRLRDDLALPARLARAGGVRARTVFSDHAFITSIERCLRQAIGHSRRYALARASQPSPPGWARLEPR